PRRGGGTRRGPRYLEPHQRAEPPAEHPADALARDPRAAQGDPARGEHGAPAQDLMHIIGGSFPRYTRSEEVSGPPRPEPPPIRAQSDAAGRNPDRDAVDPSPRRWLSATAGSSRPRRGRPRSRRRPPGRRPRP